MEKKINVTPKEYSELQKLAQISNDRLMCAGKRKIAKAQYEAILRLAKYRPNAPSPSPQHQSDVPSRLKET